MSQAHTTGKVLAGTVGAVGLLLATGQAANAASVTVKANDTVWSLAQEHGVSVKSIEKLNKIKALDENTDLIFVGQKIQVSGSQKTTKATTSTTKTKSASTAKGTYTVKAGDTLWALADQYHTSVHALQTLNGLSGDMIVTGQSLQVPGATAKRVATPVVEKTTTATSAAPKSAATSASSETTTTSSTESVSAAPVSQSSTSAASQDTTSTTAKADTATTTATTNATSASSTKDSTVATSAASSSSASASQSSKQTAKVESSSTSVASQAPVSTATSTATQSQHQSSAASSTATSQSSSTAAASSSTSQASESSTVTSTATNTSNTASSAATNNNNTASSNTTSTATNNNNNSAAANTTNNADLATGSVTGLALKLASANIPYVWGGASLSGMDCSGLVSYVYQHAAGISLPHSTVAQEGYVTTHAVSTAQPGDLLFWGSRGATYHVAIYIGNNQFVAAPQPGENVKVSTISSYFMPDFAGTLK